MIFFIIPFLFSQIEEDHIRMITSIKVAELTQILDLNEKQVVEIIPRVRRLEDLRFRFQKRRRMIIEELKLLARSQAEDSILRQKIEEYKKIVMEFRDKEERVKKGIEKLLSLRQQAKFLIFQNEFERRLRRFIRRAHKPRP